MSCLSRFRIARVFLVALAAGAAACGKDSKGITSPDPSGTGTTATNGMSARAFAYLDTAVLFTRTYFLYGDRIDWTAYRTRAFNRARNAQAFAQTYAAIDTAMQELKDPHSFFYPPGQTLGNREDPSGPLYTPTASVIAPRIGYLWLTSFGGRNPSGRADTLQRLIARTDSATAACGWIIDQRANLGGIWPAMIAGIAPLLDDGILGGYVERDTRYRYQYTLSNGSVGIVDATGARYEALRLPTIYKLRGNARPPIAILQGQFTASAGEIVVMSFKDSTRTVRTFGDSTYGVTTQPYTWTFPDTASIQVTAGMMFDRSGRNYAGWKIPADQKVSAPGVTSTFSQTFLPGNPSDAAIAAAVTWLQSLPGCRTAAATDATPASTAAGGWQASRGAPGARPASEWPRDRGVPWQAAPPR